jgi:hypothetical protein
MRQGKPPSAARSPQALSVAAYGALNCSLMELWFIVSRVIVVDSTQLHQAKGQLICTSPAILNNVLRISERQPQPSPDHDFIRTSPNVKTKVHSKYSFASVVQGRLLCDPNALPRKRPNAMPSSILPPVQRTYEKLVVFPSVCRATGSIFNEGWAFALRGLQRVLISLTSATSSNTPSTQLLLIRPRALTRMVQNWPISRRFRGCSVEGQ